MSGPFPFIGYTIPPFADKPHLLLFALWLLQSYSEQLGGDPIVHAHLSALYDTLLEQNLIRWAMTLGG